MDTYPDLKTLHILHYPSPLLRNHAQPISEVNTFLDEMSARMKELMVEGRGVGLAATQVGWPFRMLLLNTTAEPDSVQAFINPVIVKRQGRIIQEEGCLSVPGIWAKVRRAEIVRVRATLLTGEDVEINAEGFVARTWQHEIDHLDGSLFVDRVGPAAKILIAGKLRDLESVYKEVAGSNDSSDEEK